MFSPLLILSHIVSDNWKRSCISLGFWRRTYFTAWSVIGNWNGANILHIDSITLHDWGDGVGYLPHIQTSVELHGVHISEIHCPDYFYGSCEYFNAVCSKTYFFPCSNRAGLWYGIDVSNFKYLLMIPEICHVIENTLYSWFMAWMGYRILFLFSAFVDFGINCEKKDGSSYPVNDENAS